MLLEKIKTPGLSHLSYLIGSGGQAAVIDPRRDCECYVEMARAAGYYPDGEAALRLEKPLAGVSREDQ